MKRAITSLTLGVALSACAAEPAQWAIEPDPAIVDADTMFFYPEDNLAVASGRVKIIKGNTVTQADSAIVYDAEQRAELFGRKPQQLFDV